MLGVLERRQFRRVGGSSPINVDVRVVCATHRDLRARVNSGEFRQDLYYRIAVAKVEIPPLRDRPEDIPQLMEHFLIDLGIDRPLEQLIPVQTMEALAQHHWPGNVRELRNFVEAMIAIRGEIHQIETGALGPDDNPLKNAPHTQADVIGEWHRPYSREQAAFPLPWVAANKFWPSVNRIDDVYGDRHLFCACVPMEDYAA